MAVVAFLKGVNVGGHRRLRPSLLAEKLKRLDVVNIGAAGTFVVRKAIGRANLSNEITRLVPFEVDVIICGGSDILNLVSKNPFDSRIISRDIIPFVGIMATRRKASSTLPSKIPADGDWGVKVLKHQDHFVIGMYRRQMKAIGYLSQLEKFLATPLAIRNWNTMLTIAKALQT